ncbi:MAG TPA: extracellular solute-binding protein [Gemmatimonadaceae bacterium]|nr:extracellular solute-binding protein [Gemmatimonadaceae bacterium]
MSSLHRRIHLTRGPSYILAVLLAAVACGGRVGDREGARDDELDVFTAGSLARPVRAALDSFAPGTGVTPRQETAGSVELARRITELHRIPDLLAVADAELIPELLLPAHAAWYAVFAHDRLVLAYRPGSAVAARLAREPWYVVASAPEVEVGRSDPDLDPAGYRALLVMQLAERHYARPGLAERLRARAPRRNVRPKSADLVALVQAGELDLAWLYASVARANGLAVVALPPAIDLGSPADSAGYAMASVRIAGRTRGDTIVVRGRPIRFALTVPLDAPHPERGAALAAFLLSPHGLALLAREGLEVSDVPMVVGTGVPSAVTAAVAGAAGHGAAGHGAAESRTARPGAAEDTP